MAELCPNCHAPRKPGSLFCSNCGYHFNEKHCPQCSSIIRQDAAFCEECGYRIPGGDNIPVNENRVEQRIVTPPERPVIPVEQAPVYESHGKHLKEGRRSKAPVIIVIVALVIIALGAAAYFTQPLWNKQKEATVPVTAPVPDGKKEPAPPKFSYDVIKTIRPALYRSTDYVVYFKGSSEEQKECILTVEVPGFTQKYEQKISLTPQELRMKIRPPLAEGVFKTLNISKDSQVRITLQDTATQKYLIQDSKPVTILSKYDMKWWSDDGSETYYQDICAWVTPESPKIKELLRNSIDQLSAWSGGAINEIVGYQQIGGLSPDEVTYYQVAAIFETLRNYYNVRYNATPVTTSGTEAQQRIALPEDVINQQSGLCIETAVTMASAIEATGMHPMILILPGHAQVAFETWKESGDYFIIETTALTEPDWDNIIAFFDKDQWSDYLAQNQVVVIDVKQARIDGIKPME